MVGPSVDGRTGLASERQRGTSSRPTEDSRRGTSPRPTGKEVRARSGGVSMSDGVGAGAHLAGFDGALEFAEVCVDLAAGVLTEQCGEHVTDLAARRIVLQRHPDDRG